MAPWPHAPLTLTERLQASAAANPTQECLLNETSSWTYETLARDVGRLAAALVASGVEPGARVAILLNNSPLFVLSYLAVARTGAVPVPLDPVSSTLTLRHILGDCSPLAIICEAGTAGGMGDVPPPSVRAFFCPPGGESISGLWGLPVHDIDAALRENATAPAAHTGDSDLAAIVYTSGTTDIPKGVMLTHRNFAALVRTGIEIMGVTAGDRIGHILPLFHLYGLRELHIALSAGAKLVLSSQASVPASLLKWFESQGVTAFPGVPGHFSLFLGRFRERLASLGQHLRYILLGTTHTTDELLADLRSVLPNTRIFKTYGLTECGRVTTGDFTPADAPASSAGPPVPGVELTVRDPNGRVLREGEAGRIYISSDMVMKGYWQRPADNAEVLEGKCFKTRDLGYIAPNGWVFLVGRVDEMINTGGEKTAPWEVESVLRQHPSVANAAVVAAPDEEGVLGQVPKAFIVPKVGVTLESDEIRQHCARHLEPYKVPRKIVFLSRLPETALGKVQLQALKQLPE